MRKLISNGLVYDGTGAQPRKEDILVENGRIVDIGSIPPSAANEVVSADGMAVTPGFIDSHRHSDLTELTDPDFGNLELAQGIGTVLSGNCGMSPFPSSDASRQEMYDFVEPCLGKAPRALHFYSYSDYLSALRKNPPYINVGAMIGTGAVKIAAKGFGKSPFTAREMAQAQGYLAEALEDGAFGVSSGIMYTPECYSTREEFVRLLKPTARFGTVWTVHIRGEGDSLVPSVEEVIDIAKQAQIPLNISHFKSVGCRNWHDAIFRAIERIENARAGGQDVTVDFYPYTGGSTTLMSLIPPVCIEGSTADFLHVLQTRAGVEKLRTEIYREQPDWDNMVMAIGWGRIVISSVGRAENKKYQGRSVADICKDLGCDEVEFISRLLVEEDAKVGIIVMSMLQEDVDTVARLPYSMVISDSLYGAPDFPHPRLYGSFARIIREYVRERSVLNMETAVHKMTDMTAKRFRIPDRGRIAKGCFADMNFFVPEAVSDRATFVAPKQFSAGMRAVWIAGEPVWEQEHRTGRRTAAVLTRP